MPRTKKVTTTSIEFPATTCKDFLIVVSDGKALGTVNLDGSIEREYVSVNTYNLDDEIAQLYNDRNDR